VALHVTTYFLPESPRWLVAKNRQDEALKVLARLHARGDTDDLYVQAEFKEIIAKINFEKRHPAPSYFQLLFGSEWRRMWIGIGVVSNYTIHSK
jgi:Sugar (and other) transporter